MLYITKEADLVTVPSAGCNYTTTDKDRVTWRAWSERDTLEH